MLVPAHARAAAERLDHLLLRPKRTERELERTRREDGPVRVGQREGLLRGERVRPGLRVVLHVAASRLAAQPLIDVAGRGAGPLGELIGQHRVLGEHPVQAQPVTDEHVARGHRRAEVSHELVQEIHQLVLVDRHLVLRGAAQPGAWSGRRGLSSWSKRYAAGHQPGIGNRYRDQRAGLPVSGPRTPSSAAQATASRRLTAPSFPSTAAIWLSTVRTEITSWLAIWALV